MSNDNEQDTNTTLNVENEIIDETTEKSENDVVEETTTSAPKRKQIVIGADQPSPLTEEDIAAIKAEKARRAQVELDAQLNPREFEHDFLSVYLFEPFLSRITLEVSKRPTMSMPTAAVGVDPNSYELVMLYNPEFFRKMTEKERRGVIRHELYHIVFGHISGRMPVAKDMAHIWNIAADLSINSLIGEENLPSLALIPGKEIPARPDMKQLDKEIHEFVKNAPHFQAAEFYFENIKRLVEEDKKRGGDGSISVGGGVDSHEIWGKLPENVRELIKEKVEGLVRRAVNDADQKNSWGNIPAEIQERIRKMVSREVDWRSVLQNFLGRTRSPKRTSTLKRINKKMPYIYPGVKRELTANFACFIDQSGSVSDQDLCLFFGELENFSNDVELDVFHFDTEIDESSHTRWKKGVKVEPKRTRCGGTDFNAVQRFLNDRKNRGKWSGAVILTDGYADVMGQVVGTKILWVITPTGDISAARPHDYVVKMNSGMKQFRKA